MQLYENFEPYLGLLVVFAAIFCSQQNVLLNMRYKKKFGHTGGTRPGVTRCREMATLPAGYITQCKLPSASSSGSLDFIVCEVL